MQKNTYKTKQKEKILEIIVNQKDKEFTIKDIYIHTKKYAGLTTIYRLIQTLISENKIKKSVTKDNAVYYQYLDTCPNDNHFYLKCEKCNKIIHIDCDCIKDMAHHILKKHEFAMSNSGVIINGLCKKCQGKEI